MNTYSFYIVGGETPPYDVHGRELHQWPGRRQGEPTGLRRPIYGLAMTIEIIPTAVSDFLYPALFTWDRVAAAATAGIS